VAEEDDRSASAFVVGEGGEVTDVALESERAQFARTLIPATVKRDEIESIGPSRESRERAAAVQPAVDANDRGLGMLDSSFGDRETWYRRVSDEVQSVGRGRGTHEANLPCVRW
jgi:hypothetical protein